MPTTLIKHAIKFEDGQYWKSDAQRTKALEDAWTFNKADRAKTHAKQIGLQGLKVVSVEVTTSNEGPSTYAEKA